MNVLFICTANVCRSPLAEGYLKRLLQSGNYPIQVGSAGIHAVPNVSAFECAVEVAKQFEFDLRLHKARPLTAELANQADRIVCMESWQAAKVVELDPDAMSKLSLLGSFFPEGHPLFQIRDPKAFTVAETLRIFSPFIKASIENLHKQLTKV